MGTNVFGVLIGGLDRQQVPSWPRRTNPLLLSAPLERERGESSVAYLQRLAISIHRRMAVYWKRHDEAVPIAYVLKWLLAALPLLLWSIGWRLRRNKRRPLA